MHRKSLTTASSNTNLSQIWYDEEITSSPQTSVQTKSGVEGLREEVTELSDPFSTQSFHKHRVKLDTEQACSSLCDK